MAEPDGRDPPGNRTWWTDALDPAENLRTMVDPRGAGRRIAEDFAEQLLAQVGGRGGGNGSALPPNGDLNHALRQLRVDAAHAGDVWSSLIEHAFALLSTMAKRIPGSETQAGTKPLLFGPVAPGGEATGLFHVHNTSSSPVLAVGPHCGSLRSHTGCEFDASAVRFDPPALDPLPARSSCGIEVQVRVPPSAVPGTYASVILATNVPEWYLPISVTVALTDTQNGSA